MKKSAHFRGHRSSTMLANVALASVLALGMSPAAKAMAAPNEADPQQPADQAQATVAANTAAGELKANIAATVNGGSMTSDKQFTFGLFETDDTGAKTGEAIATATVKAGQSAVLDGVFYDQDNAGETITYVISELGDLGDGWTKAADQTITVKVTDNGDGTMTADVAYEGGASAAAFDNAYAAAGELKANISATVNGGSTASDKEFTFGLFETDDTGAKTGEAIATATVKAGQSAVLDGVFYDQDNAGETITYVISELGDLGDGWTKAADQKIAVTVTDNGDGTMTADVAYEGGASAAAFDNKYEEPKTPEASKSKASSTTSTSKTTSTAKTGDPLTGVATICAGAAFAGGAAALRARRMRENNR